MAAALGLVAAASAPPSVSGEESASVPTLVDRIVAVVEGGGGLGEEAEIITLFEVDVEARLVRAERSGSADGVLEPLSPSVVDAVLGTAIDQLLIQRESLRLGVGAASTASVSRERQAMALRLGGDQALERFRRATGCPSELLDAIAARRAAVNDFVAQSVTLAVRVSEEEVAAAYHAGDHPFAERPLEEVREELEARLVAQRQRERLAEWVEELRARARVRIIES